MVIIEVLTAEDHLVEQVLNCLEKVVARCETGSTMDRESVREVLDFLRQFADPCHPADGEEPLFPSRDRHGLPRQGGPTSVALKEHDRGRKHDRAMTAAVAAAAAGDFAAQYVFLKHATAYVRGLRAYLKKHDYSIFPMADRLLTDTEDQLLPTAFDGVEPDDMGEGLYKHPLRLTDAR